MSLTISDIETNTPLSMFISICLNLDTYALYRHIVQTFLGYSLDSATNTSNAINDIYEVSSQKLMVYQVSGISEMFINFSAVNLSHTIEAESNEHIYMIQYIYIYISLNLLYRI